MGKRSKGFNTPFAGLDKKIKVNAEPRTPAPKKMQAGKPKAKDEDDETAFATAMRGVERLGDQRPRIEPAKVLEPQITDDDALALAELESFVRGTGAFQLDDTGEAVAGRALGVDDRILARLKAGKFSFYRHIDLHGKSRGAAKTELTRFVAQARRDNERCVLVVTGRGLGSPGGIGVLRDALPRWLSRSPLRAHVLAFCTATPVDGGPGAFYVLLRRSGVRPFGTAS